MRSYSLIDVINAALDAERDRVFVSTSGIVQSYDPVTQTADVLPTVKHPVQSLSTGDTVYEDLPVIPGVPIVWPRFGGYVIAGPLAKGDHVILVFQTYDPTAYRITGQASEPVDLRRNSPGYPVAFPCEIADTKPLDPTTATAAASALVIGKAGAQTQIQIDATGIKLGATATDFVALSAKVDAALAALKTAFNSHQHTAPSGGGATTGNTSPVGAIASTAATITKAE